MTGQKSYEEQWKGRIEKTLQDNQDKPYLVGFKNSLSVAISSKYAYLRKIVNFMDYIQKDAKDLEYDDYTNYLNSLVGNVTTTHVNTTYAALVNFSEYLYNSGKANIDVMKRVKRPKGKESQETKEKRENAFLTQIEINKLIDATRNRKGLTSNISISREMRERDRFMLILMFCTGVRESEIYKLNVSDVNFETRRISITGKGNEVDYLPMNEKVVEAAEEWLEERDKFLGDVNEEALFLSYRKKRLVQKNISEIVIKYAELANIKKKISAHKIRASAGTQVYRETGDVMIVKEFLRHKNIETTDLYIRGIKDEKKREASKMLGEMLL